MNEPFVLRLFFTRSSGNFRNVLESPGSLDCFVWLSAVAVSRFTAGGTVFEMPEGNARPLSPSEADVRALRSLAEAAGFTTRECGVSARVDTSDVWSNNLLRIDLNGRTRTLDLQLMATGFEGPDAAALRALFNHLLNLAGIVDERLRSDLTR